MTVTNRSSVEAADVNGLKVADPRSYRTRLISLQASQGTCRPYTCNLGRLAPGASATVVAVTVATQVGVVVNIVRVWSEEIESNYRNNVAAALARVVGPFRPPPVADPARRLPHPRGLSALASGAAGVHRAADGVRPTGPAARRRRRRTRPAQGPPRGDAPDATVSRVWR